MNQKQQGERKLGLYTTIAFVIANMIGTGVFTSLGFQLQGTPNTIAVLILWIIGGVIALSGSLVYAELGAAMPRSGGEYNFLSRIYRPWLGFLSGWVSLLVGFAAPVALSAIALGNYFSRVFPFFSPMAIAIFILVLITIIHTYDIRIGGNFQNLFTFFKVMLILIFIVCGLFITPSYHNIHSDFTAFSLKDIFRPEYAVSLVWVSYAFSGWNASAYIAGDIRNPQRTIPKSLIISTAVVTVLYVLLNFTFIISAPVGALKGQVEVGYISANYIFGSIGGNIMATVISILLISTISSMIFVGPRVSQVIGEDMVIFRFLSYKSHRGTPSVAILLQSTISLFFILTSTFEQVLTYAGFTLMLFTFFTVLGVFIYRVKFPDMERPYKTWGYPVVPVIFLIITFYTIIYLFQERTLESLWGTITASSGLIFYYINYLVEKKTKVSEVKVTSEKGSEI